MAKNADSELALETLVEMGVLDEAGLERLGQMFRGVKALRGGGVPVPKGKRRGRPPKGKGSPQGNGRRGRKGKLSSVSDAEFKSMYITQGMTAKEIGGKVGVSAGAVAQRAMKLGLKKRPGRRAGKKARGKK